MARGMFHSQKNNVGLSSNQTDEEHKA